MTEETPPPTTVVEGGAANTALLGKTVAVEGPLSPSLRAFVRWGVWFRVFLAAVQFAPGSRLRAFSGK